MKPADLKPGHRITCNMPNFHGALTVITEPFTADCGPEAAARYGVAYRAEDDRVTVDVTPDDLSTRWDPDGLPAGTAAETFEWLSLTPRLRYRLFFHPDTDVQVES